MDNNANMGIVLKKNSDNTYVLDGVYSFEDESSIKKMKKGAVVPISSKKFNQMQEGESTKFLFLENKEQEYLTFVLDPKVYQALFDDLKKQGNDDSKIKQTILNSLQNISSNLDSIEVKGGLASSSCTMNFKKQYKTPSKKEEENENDNSSKIDLSNINPDELIKKIKEKVIGQDETVETIVNNIYNNQLILNYDNVDITKSSLARIMMDGPTGTGKTLIVTEVARELSIPMVNISTTSFAATGYKGNSLNDILIKLLQATNGNLELAERGIVILDEFDKLAGNNSELEMKKAVQQELLTYLGGATFPIEYEGQTYDFDTSKITFICIGAFTDLRERKIEESEDGNYTMKPEDYIKEGMMRELIGRFSLITATRSLTKEDYIQILNESKLSPLASLQELGREVYHKDIVYDQDMVEKIAELALEQDTGARALQTIVDGMQNVILSNLRDPDITQIALDDEVLEKSRAIFYRKGATK